MVQQQPSGTGFTGSVAGNTSSQLEIPTVIQTASLWELYGVPPEAGLRKVAVLVLQTKEKRLIREVK